MRNLERVSDIVVEVDGLEEDSGGLVGSFREVSGLVSRSPVLEYTAP